jgi:hypothetical protein
MQNYAAYFWQHITDFHSEKKEKVLFTQLTDGPVNQAIDQHSESGNILNQEFQEILK